MTGLVFTKKVAFAIVVSFTAKMNVAKCKLRTVPDNITRARSRLSRNLKLRLAEANRIRAKAAMESRKKVREIAETSAANLIRIALEAKKNDAKRRAAMPLEGNNKDTGASFSIT